eukprot:CAMPEP_0118808128 /NCGR_PEP_ID=MMETSP1161-20130426/35823_1 /TAXON_ID=249345 /ORGANISM="Picochlorum oklahomensis, Strain CCMP2329" /LENGTH=1104 /DNA_ID=CAMNT_0006737515 /DNA_START=107 /DNA_END=3423 /DNA_ORIENTATION=+
MAEQLFPHGTSGLIVEPSRGSRQLATWAVWGIPATTVATVYQIFQDMLPVDSLVRIEHIERIRIGRPNRSRSRQISSEIRPTVMFVITTSAPHKESLPGRTQFPLGSVYCRTNRDGEPSHDLKAWLDLLYPREQSEDSTTHWRHRDDLLWHYGWCIRPHRGYRVRANARQVRSRSSTDVHPVLQKKHVLPRIISWNIRTANGNRATIDQLLAKQRPQILAIQEHQIQAHTFPLDMRGYHTVHRSMTRDVPGARGICILYNKELPVVELPCANPNILPIRITGLLQHTDCIFVNLYLPVVSQRTAFRRTACWTEFLDLLNTYATKYPTIPIIAGGDFNMTFEELSTQLHGPFEVIHNSQFTRFPAGTCFSPSTIDFFVVSASARPFVAQEVLTKPEYDTSDHVPLVLPLQHTVQHRPVARPARRRVDVKTMLTCRRSILDDNRWAALAAFGDVEFNTDAFIQLSQEVLSDNACYVTVAQGHHQKRLHHTHSSATKTAIRQSSALTQAIRRSQQRGEDISEERLCRAREARQRAKHLRMKDNRKGWSKHIERGLRPLREGNYSKVWRWIKSMSAKKQTSLPVVPPTRDMEGNMLQDLEDIVTATRCHYSQLATDPDSQSLEWWADHQPMEQQPPIEALNEDITWEELNGVLHQLKTSKCPGMDGLPNEFLRLCRVDLTSSSPESAMGTVLLRTCNSVFSGNISDALNTSLIVSLPKPNKDFTYLSNRRGISLISCVLKLVTKIVANRFQQHAVPGGLRKEQAGFRLREECNAQAATLLEIAGRRCEEAKPTYVAFMDLQKAFDMVPHNGMLHILRAKGVSGKCWSFIQRLYTNGTFRVLVGPTTSDLAPLERGVRQGDSLSPLLFNYVMDSCLDNLSGVTVPGLSQRIPGLLLADDAVILANTETEMRDNLAAFGEWATSWHMKIGHDKCGLMVLHDQPGTSIDTEVSTATMAEARAVTGAKTLGHLAPFLAHSSIPVAMKKMVINGILLPQLCYGAEVWADKQCNIPPVQRILNDALRLTTVGRMKNKRAISTHIVHEELDIANISAIATPKGYVHGSNGVTSILGLQISSETAASLGSAGPNTPAGSSANRWHAWDSRLQMLKT